MLNDIIAKIEQLKQNVPDYTSELQDYTSYFDDLIKKHPYKEYYRLLDLTFSEILTIHIIVDHPYETSSLKNLIATHPELFNSVDNINILEILIEYFNRPTFAALIDDYVNEKRLFATFKKGILLTNYMSDYGLIFSNVYPFIKYLKRNPSIKEEAQILKGSSIEIISDTIKIAGYLKGIKQFADEKNLSAKDINKFLIASVKNGSSSFVKVTSFISRISTRYLNNLKEIKRANLKIIKSNRNLDNLITKISSKSEIMDIDEIIKLCPKSIKEEVIDYIIKHNAKYYQELYNTYKSLMDNNPQNLSLLFSKYGYNYNDLTTSNQEYLQSYTYENIENMLKYLFDYAIANINDIIYIDLSKLELFNDFLASGLSYLNLIPKPEMVYNNNSILTNILANIKELNNHKINMSNYLNSLEILPSEKIIPNLTLLNDYELFITKDTTSLMFLEAKDLSSKIDFLIETGYHNFKSLDILNYSLDELIKFKILNDLNITNYNLKIDVNEFMISSTEYKIPPDIANILKLANPKSLKMPEFLAEYQVNKQTLIIAGVYISKNRFLKNLSKFNAYSNYIIYAAIIYQSHYTLEEVESLKEFFLKEEKTKSLVRPI